MSTGDIRNNLKKLQKEVNAIRYPDEMDYDGLTKGDVNAHLPLLHHLFLNYSPSIVENMAKLNYNIAGKKNVEFLNSVFKIMRELNPSYHMTLKVKQFMAKGYAEHKIISTMNIIKFIRTCPKLTVSKGKSKTKPRNELESVSSEQCITPTDNTPGRDAVRHSSVSSIILHSGSHSVIESDYQVQPPNSRAQQSTQPSVVRHVTPLPAPELPPLEETENATQDEDIYTLVLAISDDATRMKEVLAKNTEELQKENQELKAEIESVKLESDREREKLQSKVEALEKETAELRGELDDLKILQQPQIDFENIIARLDVFESRLKSVESAEKAPEPNPGPHSPVCGNNLCSHMQNLHIPADDTIDTSHVHAPNDASLLDLSNDSPCRQQIRHRSTKLLELVQGTRSLLGISSNISGFASCGVKEDTENHPPENASD